MLSKLEMASSIIEKLYPDLNGLTVSKNLRNKKIN